MRSSSMEMLKLYIADRTGVVPIRHILNEKQKRKRENLFQHFFS